MKKTIWKIIILLIIITLLILFAYKLNIKVLNSKQIRDINAATKTVTLTAQQIANNPTKYYGESVTDYVSQNGQSDWKIFYSNGTNIFLIAGDYLENSKIDTSNDAIALRGTYGMYFWRTNKETVTDETKNLFMATGYDANSEYENTMCASTLLNTNNWENFKDNGNKAKNAIGSPTLEMWFESWNNLYPSEKLYYNNENGYRVGTSEPANHYDLLSSEIKSKAGYNNNLYYPQKDLVTEIPGMLVQCQGYFLAASYEGNTDYLYYVDYSGKISCSDTGNPSSLTTCLRPVVALNSGITVNVEEELNNYTVIFKNYDGTVLQTSTVTEGYTARYNGATPIKTEGGYNYTFTGWDRNINTPITGYTIFTAQFTKGSAIAYNITYNGVEECTFENTNPATYNVETESFTLNNPTKSGYIFTGWTGTDLTSNQNNVTIAKGSTGDRTYIANWTASTNTAYKVEHYKQQADGTYPNTPDETDNFFGTTGATVTATAKNYAGYTEDTSNTDRVPSGVIEGEGSLVLKLY